jgi:hypothetical protein
MTDDTPALREALEAYRVIIEGHLRWERVLDAKIASLIVQ